MKKTFVSSEKSFFSLVSSKTCKILFQQIWIKKKIVETQNGNFVRRKNVKQNRKIVFVFAIRFCMCNTIFI